MPTLQSPDGHSVLPASAGKIRTVPVAPRQVDGIWDRVEPFLARSYAKNEQAIPATLRADLKWGRRILWIVIEAESLTLLGAGITAIFDLLDARCCKIEHFGGSKMHMWLDQRSIIEEYAKAEGCDRVMFEGRGGWVRLLPDYRQVAVILEKRL